MNLKRLTDILRAMADVVASIDRIINEVPPMDDTQPEVAYYHCVTADDYDQPN